MKSIITLTTDFGTKDHYVGSMKGVIYGINPDTIVADVTHEVTKYNVFEGAFILSSFYGYYPNGTVHVVVVDPGVGSTRKPIAVKADGCVFVGPDNGVFSFIYKESEDVYVVEITNHRYMFPDVSKTFHGRDIFAPVAAHLSLGININELGQSVQSPTLLDIPEPKFLGDEIIGEVIYTDSFGNLVTNINSDLLSSAFIVCVDTLEIGRISDSYNDAPNGAMLSIVGSSGLLEISVNQDSASKVISDKKPLIRLKRL